MFDHRIATIETLTQIWDYNIARHPGDVRWVNWKEQYIAQHRSGMGTTFLVFWDGEPVGEGTLLFSPDCGAIGGNTALADGKTVANVNALRIRKEYEGQGQISRLVKRMEAHAASLGYSRMTIGVNASETRNLGIYLHWGYDRLLQWEVDPDDGELVLYLEKDLK